MLDLHSHNESLKLKWIGRLFSDTVNFSLWCIYVISAFKIPVIDALRCNIPPKKVNSILCKPLPEIWIDILKIWFNYNYVPLTCTSKDKRNVLLNSLFCFSEPVTEVFNKFGCGEIETQVELYEILALNNVTTWAHFMYSYNNIIQATKPLYARLLMFVIKVKLAMPEGWKWLLGEVTPENHLIRMHRLDMVINGYTTVKRDYDWLNAMKFERADKAITRWSVDLQVAGIPENWSKICRKYMSIKNPLLQDFARSFLHRSYYLNPAIATFNADVSPLCTFCNQVE